jgi:hypothetical protein
MLTMADERTPRRYTRWTRRTDGTLKADLLGMPSIVADPAAGEVRFFETGTLAAWSPDEARLVGVRLIEAATMADAERAIRQHRPDTAEG